MLYRIIDSNRLVSINETRSQQSAPAEKTLGLKSWLLDFISTHLNPSIACKRVMCNIGCHLILLISQHLKHAVVQGMLLLSRYSIFQKKIRTSTCLCQRSILYRITNAKCSSRGIFWSRNSITMCICTKMYSPSYYSDGTSPSSTTNATKNR